MYNILYKKHYDKISIAQIMQYRQKECKNYNNDTPKLFAEYKNNLYMYVGGNSYERVNKK